MADMQQKTAKEAPKLERATLEAYLGIGVSIAATANNSWCIQAFFISVAAFMVFDISRRVPVIRNSDPAIKCFLTTLATLSVILFGIYHIYPLYIGAKKRHQELQYPTFPSAIQIIQTMPDIGVQQTELISASSVLIAKHEHAITIWFLPLKHLIRLNDDRSVVDIDEPTPSTPSKLEVSEALHFPPSCTPPEGGFGTLAMKDPRVWRAVGCQIWRCTINAGVVKYEKFAHGYVISGLAGTAGSNVPAYTYFIQDKLTKKGKSFWTTTPTLKKNSAETATVYCGK